MNASATMNMAEQTIAYFSAEWYDSSEEFFFTPNAEKNVSCATVQSEQQ